MPATDQIGIGVIGLGWPGHQHTEALAHVSGARLAAACDLDDERRQQFEKTFSPAAMYRSYDELLADSTVDAVVISLPNFLHFPATLAALQAGKHVLCEKPPTLNIAEAESIRDQVRKRGLAYAFGRQMRFNTAMIAAKRAVEEGRLGRIYLAKTKWVRARGVPLGIGGWFTEKARAGGGALIDIGIHALDSAWYLAGAPKLISVTAETGAYFSAALPKTVRFDVDDSAFAFLRFEGGLAIQLEAAWAMNLTETGVTDVLDTILYGQAATIRIEPPAIFTVDPEDGKIMREQPLLTGDDAVAIELPGDKFGRQMADFLKAVRSGAPPINNIDQAVELMRMLMAIYESGATGREVRFD
jgi:predicted dehydrogenase